MELVYYHLTDDNTIVIIITITIIIKGNVVLVLTVLVLFPSLMLLKIMC